MGMAIRSAALMPIVSRGIAPTLNVHELRSPALTSVATGLGHVGASVRPPSTAAEPPLPAAPPVGVTPPVPVAFEPAEAPPALLPPPREPAVPEPALPPAPGPPAGNK